MEKQHENQIRWSSVKNPMQEEAISYATIQSWVGLWTERADKPSDLSFRDINVLFQYDPRHFLGTGCLVNDPS